MATQEKTLITVETVVNAPVEKVWDFWTDPIHITKWNAAVDDWHCPSATNDPVPGGKFSARMEARDGSMGFDFEGVYNDVKKNSLLSYFMSDGREVKVTFAESNGKTKVTETFEAETQNSIEMQRSGWQSILDNFRKYAESQMKATGKLQFEIMINAPAEKVYKTMLAPDTYTKWTAAFNPTSRYVGTWEKGSKILFIGTDEEGNQGGMVSRIRENLPNKFVSIEHLGILQGDKEVTSGPDVEGWAGALENYTLSEDNGSTFLEVEMDSNDDFATYFSETWPKALRTLKELCEN